MSVTNAEITSAAFEEGIISEELHDAILDGDTSAILENNALTNSFVDLLNRVVKLKVFGISTVNRWKPFFKERILFGSGINGLTIGQSTDKDDTDYSVTYPTDDGGVDTPSTKPEMTSKSNTGYLNNTRYTVTWTDEWLSFAIVDMYGIDSVTTEFAKANERAIDIDTDTEYTTFIKNSCADGGMANSYIMAGVQCPVAEYDDGNSTWSDDELMDMLTSIHNLSNEMAQENTDVYTDGITSNCPVDRQVLLIDYHILSLLKTRLYSGAFNLGSLQIPVDNIVPVNFGWDYTNAEPSTNGVEVEDDKYLLAVIADKEHFAIHDIKNLVKARYNEATLSTKVFHHIKRVFKEYFGKPISGVYVGKKSLI